MSELSDFNCTSDTLQHTRGYMEATQDTHTHTHTRRPEVAVNLASAFSHPGLSFLQDPRSSGQLLSARGPGEVNRLSWSGTDEECSVLLHVFSVGVLSGGNPL